METVPLKLLQYKLDCNQRSIPTRSNLRTDCRPKEKVSSNVNSEKLKGYRKKKYKKQKKNYGSCTWVGNVTTLFTVNIHLILGNFIYTIYEH